MCLCVGINPHKHYLDPIYVGYDKVNKQFYFVFYYLQVTLDI